MFDSVFEYAEGYLIVQLKDELSKKTLVSMDTCIFPFIL